MAATPTHPIQFTAPSPAELAPLFPAYEIESFIAQGGMGAVYQARQISLDRPVAIKILPREFGDDPQFRASFEAEAKAMARLNHPNLISVFDFGSADGMLYIIMEFVQGKALYYSSHGRAIDPAVALKLVATISHGLHHAHQAGIIHRDIKPANILLDPDATPKIGDFGLAHPIGFDGHDEVIFGSPGYTAPEVYHKHLVDHRSDIFSVGALLYELLTGNAPEPHSTSMTTGLDQRIDAILKKATHPDPAARFESAQQLAEALEKIIPSLGKPQFATTSHPAPVKPPVTLASSPKKSSAFPVFFFLALIVAGGAALLTLSNQKKDPPPNTPDPSLAEQTKETATNQAAEELRLKQKKERERKKQERLANRQNDSDKPENPEPTPEPPRVESPLESLARLQKNLRDGLREEFPASTIQRNGSAFFLLTTKLTWDQADQFARDHGAHLANLTTSEDLAWFHQNFKPDSSPVWLGASDSGFEGRWFWSDGSPVSPALWTPDAPNDSTSKSPEGEDFAALLPEKPALDDFEREALFPALLQWPLDDKPNSTLKAQLARTAADLAAKRSPNFPLGTYNVGGARFLLVQQSLPWEEAQSLAQNSGGHLAVPSNDREAAFISLLLRNRLPDQLSCWIGGKRHPSLAQAWTYVTGEIFSFITWHPDQPDNSNDNEPYLTLQRRGNLIAANDESPSGNNTPFYLLEWSVPSIQNLPRTSTLDDGKLLAILEEIRDQIRRTHGADYRQYRREYDETVQDFLDNAITSINNDNGLDSVSKAFLVEAAKDFKRRNELPDNLPPRAPRGLNEKLDEAKAKTAQLTKDYEEKSLKAKEDYLDSLKSAADLALRAAEQAKGEMLLLERDAILTIPSRFPAIMDNQKVPLPEKPND